MSLPPEILKKIKLLEISTRKIVNNLIAGEFHSAFRGQGMTFSEFREYVPGDDVRLISWPLMARTGKLFIKKFDEEREMSLMIVVDISGSGNFGSKKYFKGEVINYVAAILCFAALKNKDPVGLMLYSDRVEHYVPPKKGTGHVHRILRDLFYFKPQSKGTQLSVALDYLLGTLKKRANIFFCSDFLDSGFDRKLRQVGRKHDTVAVVVEDPAEAELPPMGLLDVQDPETGELVTIDTDSRRFRQQYKGLMDQRKKARDQDLRRAAVDRIDVRSDVDLIDPLLEFFRKRNRR